MLGGCLGHVQGEGWCTSQSCWWLLPLPGCQSPCRVLEQRARGHGSYGCHGCQVRDQEPEPAGHSLLSLILTFQLCSESSSSFSTLRNPGNFHVCSQIWDLNPALIKAPRDQAGPESQQGSDKEGPDILKKPSEILLGLICIHNGAQSSLPGRDEAAPLLYHPQALPSFEGNSLPLQAPKSWKSSFVSFSPQPLRGLINFLFDMVSFSFFSHG